MPVIFRYDLDWGRRGVQTSPLLMPSIDLMYHSIEVRSLGAGTLLVTMEMLPGQGRIYSACVFDLMFLRRLLMRWTWEPASVMIASACLSKSGTMACFLEGPLVVIWLVLMEGLSKAALWISMILSFGRAGKASLISRMFAAEDATCAKDLVEGRLVLPLLDFPALWCLDLSSCSFEGRGGTGGGIFLTVLRLEGEGRGGGWYW